MHHFKNPLWKRIAFPATAMLAALAGISVRPAQASLFGLSEQDEIRAGQQMAAQAQRQYGRALPASDPRSQRVRRIGMQFARLSTRRNIPFSYTVLENSTVLNAFAGPGGPVFVTTKLLQTCSNDAELAYVLGHETGHIQLRHIAKAVEKQQKVGIGAGILGAILGGRGGTNVVGAVTNVALNVWQSGYSRDHEREADVYGIQQMSKLGYDPRAAITMLGKLTDGPENAVSRALADHPSSASRQDLARQTIQAGNLLEVARRAGGPRLSDSGSGNDNFYADANPSGTGNDEGQSATRAQSLGAPLRYAEVNGRTVILAPAIGYAHWAGARLEDNAQRGSVIISRGNNSIELRPNSPFAYINGRSATMATSTQVVNGELYAPVGNLADGTGTQARYDDAQDVLVLTRGDGSQPLNVTLPS